MDTQTLHVWDGTEHRADADLMANDFEAWLIADGKTHVATEVREPHPGFFEVWVRYTHR